MKSGGILLLLLGVAASACAQTKALAANQWEVSVEGFAGIPDGTVQVRENQIVGTPLSLRHDLGVQSVWGLNLEAVRGLSASSWLRLEADAVFLRGSTVLPNDVFFNGCTLEGGTTLDTHPDFFRLTALYEKRFVEFENGGWLSGEAGLTFVIMTFKLHGTLAPGTHGTEMQEDFLTQELPVPILGLRLRLPLCIRLWFEGSLAGGYLPRIYSLKNEGGKVDLTQSHVDLGLWLRYGLTSDLAVKAGYDYSYFVQHETSGEDDNYLRLWSNSGSVALIFRF